MGCRREAPGKFLVSLTLLALDVEFLDPNINTEGFIVMIFQGGLVRYFCIQISYRPRLIPSPVLKTTPELGLPL